MEFAVFDRLQRFTANHLVRPHIPYHHRAPAVLAFGNDPLELRIIDGMIFDMHRQMALPAGYWKAFRDGPRGEHASHLETEIVVQARSVMLLHHEAVPFRAFPLLRARLRGD